MTQSASPRNPSPKRKRRSDQTRCRRCFLPLLKHPHADDDRCPITPSQKTALALFIRVEGEQWLSVIWSHRGSYTLPQDLQRLVDLMDYEGLERLGRHVRF